MLKYIVIALTLSVVGAAFFTSYQWGRSVERETKLLQQNEALLEYVEQQKEITDRYAPILGKLKTKKPSNAGGSIGVGAVIDYSIDSVPEPSKRSNK